MLPLELDLDAPLLLGVVLVGGDVRPDGAGGPLGRLALGGEREGEGLEAELLGGGRLLGEAVDVDAVDEVLLALEGDDLAGREGEDGAFEGRMAWTYRIWGVKIKAKSESCPQAL